jgi:hypothetical protein
VEEFNNRSREYQCKIQHALEEAGFASLTLFVSYYRGQGSVFAYHRAQAQTAVQDDSWRERRKDSHLGRQLTDASKQSFQQLHETDQA